MTFKDTFGVEYSEDRLTLLKCPTSLEGSYTVSPMANTIAPKSFDGCTNLTSIVLPTSLISIEANAFDNCNELKEIHYDGTIDGWLAINNNCILQYEYDLYINDELLKNVVIEGNIKEVKPYTFFNCHSIQHVLIRDGIERIGAKAFGRCNSLKRISIPNTADLKYDFIDKCNELEHIEIRGENSGKEDYYYTIEGVLFHKRKTVAANIITPYSCIVLQKYPCKRKATIYCIPEEVQEIEANAFDGATNLSLIFRKPVDVCAFSFSYADVKILVPLGAKQHFTIGYPKNSIEEIDIESYLNRKNTVEIPKQVAINPYRLLGVFSNASLKEITANKTKLTRYTSVGKSVTFDADMDGILPPLDRSEASIEKAFADLSLFQDKLKHGLFWFTKDTAIDEIALGHLNAGNIDKALELFEKRENWSSLMNRGVLSFVSGKLGDAIGYIMKVIHNDGYRSSLLLACCGDSFSVQKTEISNLFLNSLKSEIDENTLLSALYYNGLFEEANCLKNGKIDSIKAKINAEIEKSNQANPDNPEASYQAGLVLMNNTKQAIEELKRFLGLENMQYQLTVDNVAKRILQCSINYHNSAGKDVDYEKALTLAKYAESIAVGKLVRDRCIENLRVMEDNFYHAKTKDDENLIIEKLKAYKDTTPTLKRAQQLAADCQPILMRMKKVLGEQNKHYLNLSSAVVNYVLGTVIKIINDFHGKRNTRRKRRIVKEAWEVMEFVEKMDMAVDEKQHFKKNKDTLNGIKFSLDLNKKGFMDFMADHPLIWLMFVFGIIGAVIGAFSGGESFWESVGIGFGGGCGFAIFGWIYSLLTGRIKY